MWTFDMEFQSGQYGWITSAKRVPTMEAAAELAMAWLMTCMENDVTCCVRLHDMSRDPTEYKLETSK